METGSVNRRKQFSSCDACRKSRVACDAMRGRSAMGLAGLSTCSRCATRKLTCSFQWMNRHSASSNSQSSPSDHRRLSRQTASFVGISLISRLRSPDFSPYSESAEEHASDDDWREHSALSIPAMPISADVADWLRTTYEDIFEAVFGSWLGNYSCPFVFGEHGQLEPDSSEQRPLELSISISALCRQCDQWMNDLESQEKNVIDRVATQAEVEREKQIDRTLSQAIQTFSARWLPLTFRSSAQKAAQTQLIQGLWRGLRKDLLKAINRPCYRSMWSLYLFAMVPIPVGISEEEEDDGISALCAVQTALQQVLHLRARQRCVEFNGSKVSPFQDRASRIPSPNEIRSEFLSIESMIYWAALTFDTSSSLTFSSKSLLSSGLLGWESESSWRLVKSCTDIFHEQTEDWRVHGMVVSEENANRIIAAGAAWKLRVWKMAAVLKEALREGHKEETVHHAYTSAVDAIKQFNVTYRPLLMTCERRIQFLSQHTKLRWYELMLHYHLSILIMIDAIEIARRTDILEQLSITKSDVEGNIINCLVFGLSNQFSLPRPQGATKNNFVQVPLVAIDPYPHHVVAAVQLLWNGMERDYKSGALEQGTFEHLQSILLQTLELLPQTSKSVRSAKEKAQISSAQYRDSLDLRPGIP